MRRLKVMDRNGRIVDDNIVPPGGRVQVPLFLMDSVQRELATRTRIVDAHGQPHRGQGYAFDATTRTHDARGEAYEARDQYLRDAWKNPPAQQTATVKRPPNIRDATPDAALAARDAAYEEREQYLRDAWKNPPAQQKAPVKRSPIIRDATPVTHDAALAARDEAYKARNQYLQDAWRTA